MKVELIFSPGCPLVEQARKVLRRSLERAGLPWMVDEVEATGPSPTVRVNGVDVMGNPSTTAGACRLDVPTEEEVMAALRRAHDDHR